MLAKVIYIIGILLAIWCVLDIFKKSSWGIIKKIIVALLVLATSWVGFAVYYFFLKSK